jgi:hypothetical protein
MLRPALRFFPDTEMGFMAHTNRLEYNGPMPTVSVVILSYNRKTELREGLSRITSAEALPKSICR